MSARDLYQKMRYGVASLEDVKKHFEVTDITVSDITGNVSYKCMPKTYEAYNVLYPFGKFTNIIRA